MPTITSPNEWNTWSIQYDEQHANNELRNMKDGTMSVILYYNFNKISSSKYFMGISLKPQKRLEMFME